MSRQHPLVLILCGALAAGCDPSRAPRSESTESAPKEATERAPPVSSPTTPPTLEVPGPDASPRIESPSLEEIVSDAERRLELRAEERVFDWGTAYQGQTFTHTFRLQNTGDGEILVKEVKTPCGCTTSAPIENRRVAVGEWLEVPVTIDTAKFEKYTQKDVDLDCEGEVTGDLKLFLQGDVKQVLLVEPESPRLDLVRDPDRLENVQTEIELTIGIDRPVEIRSVAAEKSLVEAKLEVEEAGAVYRVRLEPRLSEDDMKVALHNETLLVSALVDEKEISLPVALSIRVVDRIDVTPARSIWFPRADTAGLLSKNSVEASSESEGSKEGPTRTLEVLSLGSPEHRFQITGIEVEKNAYETRLETVEPGRRYRLHVELRPPEDRAVRMQRASVTLHTDDPLVGDIVIPGTAQF